MWTAVDAAARYAPSPASRAPDAVVVGEPGQALKRGARRGACCALALAAFAGAAPAHAIIGGTATPKGQLRGVAGVFVAPQVTPPPPVTHQVDVAVLVLDRPTAIAPLHWAPPAEAVALTATGAPLLLAGFGASVAPPPTPDGRLAVLEASKLLKNAALTVVACTSAEAEASPFVTCAQPASLTGVAQLNGNSCAGDSGGPLFSRTAANAAAQVGVLSGGEGADQCSQFNTTIFTPLNEPMARWILTVAGGQLPPPVAAPRSCARVRRSLRRARHRKQRAVADRLARRVYRDC
jgi:hypothetical protein